MPASEQRRLRRRTLIYHLPVTDEGTGEVLGRLVDLTTDGLLLVSERAGLPGAERRLRLDLPDSVPGPDRSIQLQARTVWTRPDVNETLQLSGFQFLGVGEHEAALVETLIARLGFNDWTPAPT